MLPEDSADVEVGRSLLGEAIRQRRLSAHLTQSELAARAGIDRAHLANVELGKRLPPLDLLHALAKGLGDGTTARLLLKDVFPWDAAEPPASDS